MSVAKRIAVLIAAAVLTVCMVGCGRGVGATGPVTVTATPTSTALPTATPSPAPTATRVASDGTCQPDPYGIYADQTTFVTGLNAPPPAPPKTKHGIGSAGNNGNVTEGGESGVCTIGTFATVTQFYTTQLPSLGWQYSAPPTTLDPCFHGTVPSRVWWKGTGTFSWYDGGNAGGGSTFWSYTYCSVHA